MPIKVTNVNDGLKIKIDSDYNTTSLFSGSKKRYITLNTGSAVSIATQDTYGVVRGSDSIIIENGRVKIAPSVLENILEGAATQEWVIEQGYATSSWILSQDYASKTYLNQVLEAYPTSADLDDILVPYATKEWVEDNFSSDDLGSFFQLIKPDPLDQSTWYIRATKTLTSTGNIIAFENDFSVPIIWDDMPYATSTSVGGIKAHSTFVNGIRINNGFLEVDPSYAGGGTMEWDDILNKPTSFTPSAHTHSISDITNLQTSLNLKLDKSIFDDMFELVTQGGSTFIKAKYAFTSVGDIVAFLNDGVPGEDAGGIVETVYGVSSLGGSFDNSNLTDTFNAYTINSIHTRLQSVESGGATSVTTTGSGNAVTSVTKSGNVITVTKGSNFSLVGHAHEISDVTGLQSLLDNKSNVGHTHSIANITGLQDELDSKLVASIFNDMFELVTESGETYIKAKHSFVSVGDIIAFSDDGTPGSGGGGLIETVYGYDNLGGSFSNSTLTDTFNAYTINQINSRLISVENGSATSISITGSGNAITNVSKSGNAITFTKGSTFSLDGHTHGISDVTNLQSSLDAKANSSVSISAGNGLTGGGNLTANRTITLGTPSTITNSTTNSVSSTSHTHAIDLRHLNRSYNYLDVNGLAVAYSSDSSNPGGSWAYNLMAHTSDNSIERRGFTLSVPQNSDALYVRGTGASAIGANSANNYFGTWRRIYTDNYHPDADALGGIAAALYATKSWVTGEATAYNAARLGGYLAANYPRKAEAAVISGAWKFSGGSDYGLTIQHSITVDAIPRSASLVLGRNASYNIWRMSSQSTQAWGNNPELHFENKTTENGAWTKRITILSNGNVGINYAAPAERLHVVGNGLFTGNIGVGGSGEDGRGIQFFNNDNLKIYTSFSTNSVHGGRLDATSDVNIYFKTAGGTNRGFVFKNNNTIIAQIEGNGNFRTIGNIIATGEVTAYSSSDRRLKSDIKPITNAASIVMKLKPVQFKWNQKALELNSSKSSSVSNFGFIAQDIEEVMPDIIREVNGYKGLDDKQIISVLTKAIQELLERIESIESKLS